MRTLELINLILLALNFCFFLANNWLATGMNDYFRAIKDAYENMKELFNTADADYHRIQKQYDDIYNQQEKIFNQYKRMIKLFDARKSHERDEA